MKVWESVVCRKPPHSLPGRLTTPVGGIGQDMPPEEGMKKAGGKEERAYRLA